MNTRHHRLLATIGLALVGLLAPAVGGERYSSWKKDRIIEIAAKYIDDTKAEVTLRAAAVEKDTGEAAPLDDKDHNPPTEEATRNERFLAGRLNIKDTYLHIGAFEASGGAVI